MDEIILRIDGMHCGACVHRVTRALQIVDGTEVEEVRLGAARVRVKDRASAESALLASIGKIGFSARIEQ